MAGIFVASWVSGMTGLAFPTIATPLFLLLFSPLETVALTAACSLTGQIVSMLLLRRRVAYALRWQLVISGLFGVPLGVSLLSIVSVHEFGMIAGSFIALASLWWLFRPSIHAGDGHPAVEILVGLAGDCRVVSSASRRRFLQSGVPRAGCRRNANELCCNPSS